MKMSSTVKLLKSVFLWSTFLLLLSACSESDSSQLEEKWQLSEVTGSEADAALKSHVFFSFMKGAFMANCITSSGNYEQYSGTYRLSGDALQITFLPYTTIAPEFKHFLEWTDSSRTFKVLSLSEKTLVLQWSDSNDSANYTYRFRKY